MIQGFFSLHPQPKIHTLHQRTENKDNFTSQIYFIMYRQHQDYHKHCSSIVNFGRMNRMVLAAAALNNQATVFLNDGDMSAANQSLSQALVATRHCLVDIQHFGGLEEREQKQLEISPLNLQDICKFGQLEATRTTESLGATYKGPYGRRSRSLLAKKTKFSKKYGSEVDGDTSSFFVFERPLQVDVEGIKNQLQFSSAINSAISSHYKTSIVVLEIISFAVVFNLAICHHLQALTCIDARMRRKGLNAAVGLYNQAQRLYLALPKRRDGGDSCLVMLIISNNLGQAFDDMGVQESSRYYFGQLAAAFASYTSSIDDMPLGRRWCFLDLDFSGFIANIMSLVLQCHSAAAA